jgi:hypothetical protein
VNTCSDDDGGGGGSGSLEKVKEEEEEVAVLKEEETVMVMISHLPKTRVFASRRCLKAALQRVSRQRHYPIEYACAAR